MERVIIRSGIEITIGIRFFHLKKPTKKKIAININFVIMYPIINNNNGFKM